MDRTAILGYPLFGRATAPIPWINGAGMATTEAITAILRHGIADQYDVFIPHGPTGAINSFRSTLAERGIALERVSVIPFDCLRRTLSTRRYLAVHDPGGCLLGRLAALVHPIAPEATPCTCVQFSISYGSLLPQFLETCVSKLPSFDAMFCCSTDARTAMERILNHLCTVIDLPVGTWSQRLELVPLGVNVDMFAPPFPRSIARRLLGLPTDGRYLLYLGRLTPLDKADLDVLLRVFATLRRDSANQDLHLLLAGDDTRRYGAYLRGRAQLLGVAEALHILPSIPMTTKQLALWSADIFVSPVDSVQESFGLAVVEAMAAGLPAVVSDWGGYRDIVAEGISGFRIPTMWAPCTSAVESQSELGLPFSDHLILGQGVVVDEDILAERLRQLLDNPTLRRNMGCRARERAALYDWTAIVKQYEAIWFALKEEAQATREVRRPPVRFPFWHIFRHYATHSVQPHDVVELRRSALPTPSPPPDLEFLLSTHILKRLLTALADGSQEVSTLVQSEADLFGILWLAKAGAVRIRTEVGRGVGAPGKPPRQDGCCGNPLPDGSAHALPLGSS